MAWCGFTLSSPCHDQNNSSSVYETSATAWLVSSNILIDFDYYNDNNFYMLKNQNIVIVLINHQWSNDDDEDKQVIQFVN